MKVMGGISRDERLAAGMARVQLPTTFRGEVLTEPVMKIRTHAA